VISQIVGDIPLPDHRVGSAVNPSCHASCHPVCSSDYVPGWCRVGRMAQGMIPALTASNLQALRLSKSSSRPRPPHNPARLLPFSCPALHAFAAVPLQRGVNVLSRVPPQARKPYTIRQTRAAGSSPRLSAGHGGVLRRGAGTGTVRGAGHAWRWPSTCRPPGV